MVELQILVEVRPPFGNRPFAPEIPPDHSGDLRLRLGWQGIYPANPIFRRQLRKAAPLAYFLAFLGTQVMPAFLLVSCFGPHAFLLIQRSANTSFLNNSRIFLLDRNFHVSAICKTNAVSIATLISNQFSVIISVLLSCLR
jgi:hypothetical protein